MKYQAIWRQPGHQTNDYPKLMVDDDVQSGSINIRNTRLPLWSIITTVIAQGWDVAEDGWEPASRYGFRREDLAHFLYCLLEQRGEFGRLLLMLANAESKSECWWKRKTHRGNIIKQLTRCKETLSRIDYEETKAKDYI